MAATARRVTHPSLDERRAAGRELKKRTPPESHRRWRPAADRPDPVGLLDEQNVRRESDLVPVRHGRMLVSPLTFYRGAARIMAADLRATPRAGLTVQLCGDAHLSNFGAFASPERTLLFDLNDFDETLPGPFEYDVMRLAASLTIAARNSGFGKADAREAALSSVRAYREAMLDFSQMRVLDVWYAKLTEDDVMESLRTLEAAQKTVAKKREVQRGEAWAAHILMRAHERNSLQALEKLTEMVDGSHRIVSRPPVIVPARDLPEVWDMSPDELSQDVTHLFRSYRATLQADRRHLLEQFRIVDVARKVVGVGSVGTRAFIALLQGRDAEDPLFLQVKEATRSVLEDHLPKSRYDPGARVVHGQRLMQAASDIFLGWTKGIDPGRYYYWRQFRDMKGSVEVEMLRPRGLAFYGTVCGRTLARAHARSGDPVAIATYLGKSDAFDLAIADFSRRYADQTERDHEAFVQAVRKGRLEALEGV